jgi:hypothetical protein
MRSGSAACRNRLTHLAMDLVTRYASRLIGLPFSTVQLPARVLVIVALPSTASPS